MRKDTKHLLDEICTLESIEDFLFVGGTAMAYHVTHRVSEDLDFGFLGFKLPTTSIKDIISRLSQSHSVSMQTDVTAIQEAENEGINLLDHHQDWLVGEVKVTFFTLGEDVKEREAIQAFSTSKYGHVNVLDLDGLFFTKCMVLTRRVKSRDIFDLWWFTEHGNKTIQDIFNTIQHVMPYMTYEMIRHRLLDWPISLTDEGLEPVGINLGIEGIRNLLREKVNQLEVNMAKAYLSDSNH